MGRARRQHARQVRVAGGAAIWWMVSNALPRFGVHYLIASTAGTANRHGPGLFKADAGW